MSFTKINITTNNFTALFVLVVSGFSYDSDKMRDGLRPAIGDRSSVVDKIN
ncbi:MAG TPA: hypothetical protein V6D25_13850 [Leptolyngbyaceae cyanobacterium]